jgi:GDP-L-fucose synthase
MAAASVYVMNLSSEACQINTQKMLRHINVGTGIDCAIRELVETVAKVVGFEDSISFDASKPDGAPRKLMNVDRMKALGWRYSIDFKRGLAETYEWFLQNQHSFRE